jgi:hypothetical protein
MWPDLRISAEERDPLLDILNTHRGPSERDPWHGSVRLQPGSEKTGRIAGPNSGKSARGQAFWSTCTRLAKDVDRDSERDCFKRKGGTMPYHLTHTDDEEDDKLEKPKEAEQEEDEEEEDEEGPGRQMLYLDCPKQMLKL